MLDLIKAIVLSALVVFLMVLLGPFAAYVLGGIVLIVGLLIVYYLRTVLIPVGVILGGMYLLWKIATSLRMPSIPKPRFAIPTFHFPRIVLPTVPFAVIEAVLFIVLVGAAAFVLMFLRRAVYGFIEGFREGRRPRDTYFVMDELREELEQRDTQPTERARSMATQPGLPDPDPELETEEDPYENIEPLLPD